jgi:hypothetical protein
MPKSVAPPTPKPKRAETASKRTFRNPRNSEEERRKAIALLNDWSDAHVPVELMPVVWDLGSWAISSNCR